MLINEHTWQYIFKHQEDDVRSLALQGNKDTEVELAKALQQIAGWQTARRKLPIWAATERLLFPPHLNMEQCSSEQTARYKAQLVGRGTSMADLTGGFGVDFYWMAQGFQQRTYVEVNEQLCEISSANFRLLGLDCQVCCQDCVTYLSNMEPVTLIYLDPARRNRQGARTYSIADCTPNVIELLPLLLQKSESVLLKLSPMLDWRKAVSDLGAVREVHIVSVDNECKELLLLLSREPSSQLRLCCVNNDIVFEEVVSLQDSLSSESYITDIPIDVAPAYLYEPNASVMKAGCFQALQQRFRVRQVAQNSHLFLATHKVKDFPGRGFQIQSVSTMNKHDLRKILGNLQQANISVRNFPMSADQLRKRLKVRDGGNVYIFATTVEDSSHKLFICRKIS